MQNEINFIVDTASPKSLLPAHLYGDQAEPSNSYNLSGPDGHSLQIFGTITLLVSFADMPGSIQHEFIVVNVTHAILGIDILRKMGVTIDLSSNSVTFPNGKLNADQALPALPEIDYDVTTCLDILHLFPNVTSGQFFKGNLTLPFEHSFKVTGPPFSHAARKMSPEKQRELDRQLDDMLRQGIIEYSRSPYTSPVHLVPKKEKGAYRFCVDYRKLNAQTENQSFSLPRIFDVTNRLHGAKVFSSLDLRNAYWQVNIRPSDRIYTAFSCPRGTFQFRKIPMGTKNSAFSFQMAISYILKGTEDFAFAYIDDILVFSKDTQEHKRHLHDIANRLNAYGFTLNMKKSTIEVSEIEMLGHKINKDGIFVLQDRIAAIERLPEPTSIKELRHAMGLINFQRRFIKNAAKILLPLTKYLQGKVKNEDKIFLSEEAKKAFSDIKLALANATGLAHPREDSALRLYTDASTAALGAVLVQKLPDGREQALAYFSKALNETQKRYSIFDLELLAVFSAVKHFEHMILDRSFTIVTDHLSLVHAFRKPSPSHSPRQSRQLSYLTEFNCTFEHIAGHRNSTADCLSRLVINNIFLQDTLNITIQEIALEQKRCMSTSPEVFQFPEQSSIQLQWANIDGDLQNGCSQILVDVSHNRQRILVPPRFETLIIDHYHNLNHFGVRATQRFITSRFLFQAINRKIRDRVRSCEACQKTKVYRHVISPIAPAKMPATRFSTVHADLCGPYPECQGYSYLLVCVDRFTRFVSAYPLQNIKTESVIVGMNSYLSTFGQMQSLRVDNGVQWTSRLFREYCAFLGCDLCISNTRYPESNGLVERNIKNIKVALTAKLNRLNWVFYLGSVVLSINSMHRRELGCSSADIVFFQSLRLPGDMFLPTRNENAFSATLIGQMRRFAASIRPSPTRVEQSRKIYMPPELKTCSHIFVKQDPIKPNLTPPYSGPYLVVSRTDKTFRVLNNDRIMSVAINNVKPCFQLNNAEDVSAETPIFCESASASPHCSNFTDRLFRIPTEQSNDVELSSTASLRPSNDPHSSTNFSKRKISRPRRFDDFEVYV